MTPIRLDPSEPQIEDPSQPLDLTHWQPQDKRTSKLTRCLEALRDVTTAFRPVADAGEDVDKRLLKQSITPIYTLATALRDLSNELQNNCHQELNDKEKAAIAHHFTIFTKAVPTDSASPLKIARDKLSAHLDKDTLTPGYRDFWNQFDLSSVADWIIGCVRMFAIFIQPDLYHWTRNGGQAGRVTVMRFNQLELQLVVGGDEVADISELRLSRSPKEAIDRELRELVVVVRSKCPDAGNGPDSPYKQPELGEGEQQS